MKTFKAIAAMSLNRVIGRNNQLPWNIPEELEWFKKMTLHTAILMGRKTFESIGRPLPKRENIVISRSKPSHLTPGVHYITEFSQISTDKAVWVIGGAEIYKLTLPYTSDLYLTTVKQTVSDGDAFFPNFEDSFQAKEVIEDNEKFSITHYINPNPLDYETLSKNSNSLKLSNPH